MIRGKCPTCRKPFEVARIDDLPGFPFCSERCKLVDLGRWIDGDFVLPEKAADVPGSLDLADDSEDD